ncbi:unnamed protein product [Rhizoctonia solani]|uniref:Uncharacterized protein n=1 Tax=Rhizoctonia solani TaxID=456999 RepID=A0A8H3DU35_9AGAM|nr:unnamed protein product [Rhizoctonia solani]
MSNEYQSHGIKMSSASSLKGSIATHPENSSSFPHRIRDVFPPGLDSSCSTRGARGHYTLAPGQLHRTLTSCYGPEKHVDSIVVKSAWYGRQSKLAKQEFIVLRVEDLEIDGLTNYLVLDRTTSTPSSVFSGLIPHSRLRFQGEMARDAFKIAYDGNVGQLLQECNLSPHKYLERLDFKPEESLLLYQLSTLVYIISERYPQFRVADINGSGFAGLAWECMREIRPSASHTHLDQGAKKRGKLGWIHPAPDSVEVTEICQLFHKEALAVTMELSKQKSIWATVSS